MPPPPPIVSCVVVKDPPQSVRSLNRHKKRPKPNQTNYYCYPPPGINFTVRSHQENIVSGGQRKIYSNQNQQTRTSRQQQQQTHTHEHTEKHQNSPNSPPRIESRYQVCIKTTHQTSTGKTSGGQGELPPTLAPPITSAQNSAKHHNALKSCDPHAGIVSACPS